MQSLPDSALPFCFMENEWNARIWQSSIHLRIKWMGLDDEKDLKIS